MDSGHRQRAKGAIATQAAHISNGHTGPAALITPIKAHATKITATPTSRARSGEGREGSDIRLNLAKRDRARVMPQYDPA